METPPHDKQHRARPEFHSAGPWYAFVVIGLAVFFLGLAITRNPQREFRASARVVFDIFQRGDAETGSQAGDGDPLQQAMQKIKSPEAFLRIAPQLGSALGPENRTNLMNWAQNWSGRVQVDRGISSGGQPLVTIRFWSRVPEVSIGVVSQLAEQMVRDAHAPRGINADRARQQDAAVRQRDVDEARHALDAYVSTEMARLTSELESLSAPALGAQDRSDERIDSEPIPHPEHVRLQREVEAARDDVEQLLIHRDPRNELMVQAQRRLDDLRQQLAEVPEFLDASRDALVLVRHKNPITPDQRARLRAEIEATARYRELAVMHSAAQRRYIETTMERSPESSLADGVSFTCRIEGRTEIDQWRGGRPSRRDLAQLSLISVACAFVISALRRPPSRATLQSVDEIRHGFGLEVLAVLQARDGPRPARSVFRAVAPAKWMTMAAEIVVVAVVAMLILLAIFDPAFAKQLVRDPFAAYGYAVDRVLDWF